MASISAEPGRARDDEKGPSTTLTAHGDGTYHTSSESWGGGKRVEHASIGAALLHIAKRHSEGDHVHVHADDDGYTTHAMKEGGKVQGPVKHKNLRGLKKAMDQFLDEEGHEDE